MVYYLISITKNYVEATTDSDNQIGGMKLTHVKAEREFQALHASFSVMVIALCAFI